MTNMDMKERYIHELAKIVYDAKHPSKYWGLRREDGTLIDKDADSKTILGIVGVFTPREFMDLVKGYDLDIKDLPSLGSYDTTKEEDGIFIEKNDPLSSMQEGRLYAIIQENKKLCVGLNTKNDKTMSAVVMDRQEDGIYLYTTSTDEIRFISNEKLSELCNEWVKLFPRGTELPTKEEIIENLTHSNSLFSLVGSGETIANNVHNGQGVDESRLNQLFTMGIKEYMDMYSPRVVEPYESELSEVAEWNR